MANKRKIRDREAIEEITYKNKEDILFRLFECVTFNTENSVTLYYVDDIHYVVVDNGTGKIIQLANLNDSEWMFN